MSRYFETLYAALMLDEVDDYEDAIDELTQYISMGVDIGAAYHNRAVAYWEIGQTDKSLNDFDNAIALLPKDYMPLKIKGVLLHKLGRIDEAITSLNLAIQLSPDTATLRRARAYMFIDTGKLKEALQDFDCAIELEPNFKYTIIERDKLKSHIASLSI